MNHKFIMFQTADPYAAGEGDSNGIPVCPSTFLQATIALCVSSFRSLLMTVGAVPRHHCPLEWWDCQHFFLCLSSLQVSAQSWISYCAPLSAEKKKTALDRYRRISAPGRAGSCSRRVDVTLQSPERSNHLSGGSYILPIRDTVFKGEPDNQQEENLAQTYPVFEL